MIQILLGSDDITDFMSNMDMVQKIYDNDIDVLKTMEDQHKQVEAQKQKLENLHANLESDKQTGSG